LRKIFLKSALLCRLSEAQAWGDSTPGSLRFTWGYSWLRLSEAAHAARRSFIKSRYAARQPSKFIPLYPGRRLRLPWAGMSRPVGAFAASRQWTWWTAVALIWCF